MQSAFEVARSCNLLATSASKKFKGDSHYTGSDNEHDDFNNFTMNKGFIQYNFQMVSDCQNYF